MQAVIQQIKETFGEVTLEDDTLHQAQLADQSLSRTISPKEYLEAKKLDPETDWQEIPGFKLEECDAALSFLSPAGWRFYIPAYMVRALELLSSKPDFIGSVVFHLTYPASKHGYDAQRYTQDRFEMLNERQADSVVTFLDYAVTHDTQYRGLEKDARLALEKYWNTSKDARPNCESAN